MKSEIDSSPGEIHRATTRRGFLKACGTAAITVVAGAAATFPLRKAFAAVPVWATIPTQVWAVGVPVQLNLANYCTDADGDPLTFELDQPLPPGVTRNGSVISGTPTGVFAARQYVATADDGGDSVPPAAPIDLREK